MGEYRRMEGLVACDRPIWKREGGDQYFFYTKGNDWMVGPDYNKDWGGIKSAKLGLERIPATGWEFYSGGVQGWTSDPQLRVEGESSILT